MSRIREAGERVTPLLLTYNEEPNLARSLEALWWARRIIVLDSGSTDRTAEIARSFAHVELHVRKFDGHASQWSFGVHQTGIDTEYVLALDADMRPSEAFLAELSETFLAGAYAGALTGFEFHHLGHPLKGSIYPPVYRVFRRDAVSIEQVGHTQEFRVSGPLYTFRAKLIHDDRKELDRWVRSQIEYSRLEQQRMSAAAAPGVKDRLRLTGLMPLAAGLLAYLRSGGPLAGKAALCYAYERMTYESLLAMRILRQSSREPGQ